MLPKTKTKFALNNLSYLPQFAAYLLQKRLNEFSISQLQCLKDLEAPVLKLFQQLNEEQLKNTAVQLNRRFLEYLAHNKAEDLLEVASDEWKSNGQLLLVVSQEDIKAEDVTLFALSRKKALHHFIPEYCTDHRQVLHLVNEIDLYLTALETVSFNASIRLLQKRIQQEAHINKRITDSSPGIIYVFTAAGNEVQYVNKKGEDFLGYTRSEINALGDETWIALVHPEDVQRVLNARQELISAKDGDTRIEYRLKNKNGTYRWMRTNLTPFKRDEEDNITEVICFLRDIEEEKNAQQQLEESRRQLLEAQEIARLGSYVWYFANSNSQMSPQCRKILEVEVDEHDGFWKRIHPDDREKVVAEVKKAIEVTGIFDSEYRYQGKEKEKVIWTRGVVNYENGTAVSMRGTVMDVTERHHILEKLTETNKLYEQAQALSHLGHYIIDFEKNDATFTNEVIRIYGLDPSENVSWDTLRQFRHPDDKEWIEKEMQTAFEKGHNFDIHYRILLRSGTVKIIHSRGEAVLNKDGKVIKYIGTLQDVTEHKTLLQRLEESEALYKQAQALAHIGSWQNEVKKNKMYWSEESFRIFGLEPQTEVIKEETFYSLIHPDDRARVKKAVEAAIRNQQPIDLYYRIRLQDGTTKIVLAKGHPETGEHGEVVRIVGSTQDVTEQRELMERLKQSEELYKQTEAMAHLGSWSQDVQTGKTHWSDELFRILDLPILPEPISFEEFISFIHPDDRKLYEEKFSHALQKQQPFQMEYRIITKEGAVKTLLVHTEVQTDTAGKTSALFGFVQDITEKKEAETRLQESQNFIKKITNTAPSMIALYNLHSGRHLFVNEGIKKLLGYEVEDALKGGLDFIFGLVHPDDQMDGENFKQAFNEISKSDEQGKAIFENTYRIRHKDGQWRWFTTYTTIFDKNAEGEVEHLLNVSLDVTAQKKTEQELIEQQHFIQHIAEASPTILYVFDVEKNSIVYVNREIFFVLGYTPEEILEMGNKVTELIYHPDDMHLLPERKQSEKRIIENDLMLQYECRMKTKEGEWQWFLVREVVFKNNEEDKVAQIVGAALDISKRKDMEKILLQNSFKLEQSNASLEEFAYVASHDLKEPLRKISTFGDRLVATQMDNLSPEGKIYLRKIVDASQRMQTMISDLLSISLISGDKSYEPYSLQSILEEVLQTLEFKIEQKNAVINADELPVASIIPSQFRQLFQNLLSNSLKFVREGVQPVITIKYNYLEGEEASQMGNANRYLKIEFTDNGIGFENEFAGKIFAIFQRLHGRSEYEGSGIGLSICKKIVEHHGGIIYATGIPGKGASFTIILPE